jgi:acetyl-CoA carboxylase biotin carboxyl carrier protein
MSLTPADINSIVAALQESDWDEAEVLIGDVKISVARNGSRLNLAGAAPRLDSSAVVPATTPPVPVAVPIVSPAAPSGPVEGSTDFIVKAPSVGVFWGASEPGAPAFVEIGASVGPESTVCIVEIMKLMNNVAAGVAGVISAIHVENGQSVQFGAPLFSIRADAS